MPIDPSQVKWDDDKIDLTKVKWDGPNMAVVDDMGTGERLAAAAGAKVAGGLRALGANSFIKRLGLPATKEEADALEAPLMSTTAGKVGGALGSVGVLAPTILLPGSSGYVGAALYGAGGNAAITEGGVGERAKAAAGGAAGGVAGKFAGDKLAEGARWLLDRAAAKGAQRQAASAGTDAAVAAGREAGYAVTPSMTNRPGAVGSALEALGGKIKGQQAVSVANQQNTNKLAARSLGLDEEVPITTEALDGLRREAGKAYANVAKAGKFQASANDLPKSANVKTFTDRLTLGRRSEVDAADLVEAWKQANHDATGYYRAYGRDANPETLAKAKQLASDAKRIDEFMTKKLTEIGRGDLVDALKGARVQIAKSYSVENALNTATGAVDARKLANQLSKGKPLSGDLKKAAEFAAAFPKATQSGVDVPAYSPLDIFSANQGNNLLSLLTLHRPVARAAMLSSPMQNALARPGNYSPNLLARSAPPMLDNPIARALMLTGGQAAGANVANRK